MRFLILTLMMLVPLAHSEASSQTSSQQASPQQASQIIFKADTSLEWRSNQKQYIATGNAVIEQGNLIMTAASIIATYADDESAKTESAKTAGRVSFTNIKGIGGKPVIKYLGDEIRAEESIVYDRLAHIITATGKAVIIFDDGKRLEGKMIVAKLDDGEADFISIRANGGMEFSDSDAANTRNVRADEAEYIKKTGIITLTGAVVLTDNDNTLRGDSGHINTLSGEVIISASETALDTNLDTNQDNNRVRGIFTNIP